MKSITRWLTLGAVVAASSSMAFATSLTTGQTVTATPIDLSATSIAASVSGPLTAGTFTGNYVEYVVYDAANIYNSQCGGSGCLTFVLAVSNNAGSPNGMEHVSNGDGGPPFGSLTPNDGFENYSLNVGYSVAGTGVAPFTVDESRYGTVEFNFTGGGAIAPGSYTDYLVIETDASNYTTGNFSAIDSTTDTVEGFVPAAATPEPTGIALLGTGLLGLAGVVRRRIA